MLNMLIPVPVRDMTPSDPVTMPGKLRSHLHAQTRHGLDTSAQERMHARDGQYGGGRVTLGRADAAQVVTGEYMVTA
jgi:hypothetical protein